jgi:tetratricopeptide (TPR) repeat protein
MKKTASISLILLCLMSFLQADFQDDWDAGLKYLKEENFVSAEKELTKAICQLELLQDMSKPIIYIDRSEAYYSLKMYNEALEDLKKALLSTLLKNDERIRGLSYRIIICIKLGLDHSEDSKEQERISPRSYEINETSMIIKNVPDNEILREMMTTYLIRSGFCESENDIKILDSGEMVVEKSESGWGKNLIFKEIEPFEPSDASS